MKNILVVNVNWLGDAVFSAPIFRALKEEYPQARITCLAVPRVKEILESIEHVDEIIIYDEKGTDWSFWAKWKIVGKLKQKKFDAAFLLHRSWTRALLIYLAGIPKRIGYDEKKRGVLLTDSTPAVVQQIHRLDYYAHIVESFGIEVKDKTTRLIVDDDSRRAVDCLLQKYDIFLNERFIIINCGGNWGLKRWPKENFIKLINWLLNAHAVKIVLTGAQKDIPATDEIKQSVDYPSRVINLSGQTALKELMALLKRGSLVISADSGPIHIASSVGAHVLAIFGPTRPEITGPRGVGKTVILQKEVGCNKHACYYLACPDNICMQAVSVKDVTDAVEGILRS